MPLYFDQKLWRCRGFPGNSEYFLWQTLKLLTGPTFRSFLENWHRLCLKILQKNQWHLNCITGALTYNFKHTCTKQIKYIFLNLCSKNPYSNQNNILLIKSINASSIFINIKHIYRMGQIRINFFPNLTKIRLVILFLCDTL